MALAAQTHTRNSLTVEIAEEMQIAFEIANRNGRVESDQAVSARGVSKNSGARIHRRCGVSAQLLSLHL